MKWYLNVLGQAANFSGRTRRREFWGFVLITATIITTLALFEQWSGLTIAGVANLPAKLYTLIITIPFLAISRRRLHDVGRSGRWLFISPFSPFQLVLLYFFIQNSDSSNRFGADLKELSKRARFGVEERVLSDLVETHQIIGMSILQAQSAAKEIAMLSKQELFEQGISGEVIYLEGNGDKFLRLAQIDSNVRAQLFALHRNGVTDEDVRNWHNLSFFEKSVLLNSDKIIISANVKTAMRQGYNYEEALFIVLKHHATFTDDISRINNQDSFLPAELKLRVNKYRNKRLMQDPERFKFELDSSSSFNSFIRDKQQHGLI